jgi:hypothetical protein
MNKRKNNKRKLWAAIQFIKYATFFSLLYLLMRVIMYNYNPADYAHAYIMIQADDFVIILLSLVVIIID